MTLLRRRLIAWGVLALALAAGLAYAFWPRPLPVDLATVARGPLTVTVDEEGETRIRDVYVLSAPIGGRALRIELDPGDPVTANRTVVATIQPADPTFLDVRTEAERRAAVGTAEAAEAHAAADVERARAELEFADRELKRARRLVPGQSISQQTVDQAERTYRSRLAELHTAEAMLAMRRSELEGAKAQLISPREPRGDDKDCACIPVRAPVGGEVLRVLHESEGVIAAGAPLVEIGDPHNLEIVADFLSTEAVKIRPGQDVIVDEWGGPAPLAGRVRRVEPFGYTKVSALGIEERRVNVVIDLTSPPEAWHRLAHGFRVEARVVLWRGDDVLKVPVTALFRTDGDGARNGWALFVDEGGRARLRRVQAGHANGLETEIVKGLAAGERIVLYPSDRVTDGTRIAPRR